MDLCLIADISSVLMSTLATTWTVLKVLAGLGLVIFVHELGHFLVAKMCGVKCEKFYLGFDVPIRIGPLRLPRTLGKFQWGETEYGVGIIPLGGYVKMLGQDDNPANAQKEAERIRRPKDGQSETPGDEAQPSEQGEEPEWEWDPRSYPAKSVPQRMAIISAGVIMNLIFAVIFGMIAYGVGVKYEPCEIGGTSPGSPAWINNLPVGAEIVQLGEDGTESEHLRFMWDLKQYVAFSSMENRPVNLKLRTPGGTEQWVSLEPDMRLVKQQLEEFPTIGIRSTNSSTLSNDRPAVPHMAAGKATPPFTAEDKIVGVEGAPLDRDRANELGDYPAYEVERALATKLDQPLTFQVRRAGSDGATSGSPKTLDITVPPSPLQTVGLSLRIGPIEAVRKESPAAAAGFQPGDRMLTVQGEDIGDPMVLSQRMRKWIGQEVAIAVERESDEGTETVELSVVPEARFRYAPSFLPGSLVAIEPLGVAFSVENTVVGVAAGSPAAEAGLQAGDLIAAVEFEAVSDEAIAEVKELFGGSLGEPIEFEEQISNWPYISNLLQSLPPGVDMKVSFTRGGEKLNATLRAEPSEQWYHPDRGLRLVMLRRVHTADSWASACTLGLRATKEGMGRVFDFLGKFATGQISLGKVGGPLMIAAVAGSEASQGIPRLLIFLTLLSANLAILNFLPIPALDGGHMVFLTAEAITGKPVDERLQGALTLLGVAALLALMVLVFANDIHRLFL